MARINMFMYVIPNEDILVRDPQSKRIVPPEGLEVESSLFWHRRFLDGDITIHDKKPAWPVEDNQ